MRTDAENFALRCGCAIRAEGRDYMFSSNGRRSRPKGACPMLRKTMIVVATAAALTEGLTADAFARGAGDGKRP